MTSSNEIATFAAGCFWCIETALNNIKGVESAISGYMGGETTDPTYETICTGTTGHAEVVHVSFDPKVISFRELLEIFFTLHNPTQLNRQGNDVGTQYRSAVFVHSQDQKDAALNIINEINTAQIWPDKVVTEVTTASTFYPGEAHHQGYFAANPANPYCQVIVAPKLAKFKQTFAEKLK